MEGPASLERSLTEALGAGDGDFVFRSSAISSSDADVTLDRVGGAFDLGA